MLLGPRRTLKSTHPSGNTLQLGSRNANDGSCGKNVAMDDAELVARIDRLVAEEHALERDHLGELNPQDQARLDHLGVQLDQCWDLLRQRRARRRAGRDPDDAQLRSATVVEKYVQ